MYQSKLRDYLNKIKFISAFVAEKGNKQCRKMKSKDYRKN